MRWDHRIGGRLRVRDLHIFLTVAEHGNMAKAAEELAVSRPVVSRAIADLEQVLGVPLFDRMPGGISPTRYGKELVSRGFAVLDELRHSIQAIEQLKDPTFGELRFATGEALAGGIVAKAIELVARRISVLSYTMEPAMAAMVVPYLRERRGELVVTRLASTELEPDIAAEPLYTERMLVVAGKDSVWSRRRRLSWSELLDAPWILSPVEVTRESPFTEALSNLGALPSNLILSTSLNLRVGLLPTGRFVTLMPYSVLRFGSLRKLVSPLPFELPAWRLPVAIFSLRHRTLSPAALMFAEEMRALGRQMAR
jgi:DNA-binding transcriptional LysR family regulator